MSFQDKILFLSNTTSQAMKRGLGNLQCLKNSSGVSFVSSLQMLCRRLSDCVKYLSDVEGIENVIGIDVWPRCC